MKSLRHIFQWTVGIICGLYVVLQLAMQLSTVQRKVADIAEDFLHDSWGWDISIDRVRLELGLRLILDEVNLDDRQGIRMLHISRIAAKPDVIGILSGQIAIANAQLFGTQARLYQTTPEDKPNFQFLIDTFKSNDNNKKKPIDLRMGTLVLRRVAISWDRQWLPRRSFDRFDSNHISLSDITLTANLHRLTPDTCDLTIRRLSFKERCGFSLNKLAFILKAGRHQSHIDRFNLSLSGSSIAIPAFTATYNDLPGRNIVNWLSTAFWNTSLDLRLSRADLLHFVTLPDEVPECLRLSLDAVGGDNQAHFTNIRLTTHGKVPQLLADIKVNNLSGETLTEVNLQKLRIGREWTGMLPVSLGVVDLTGKMLISKRRILSDMNLKTEYGSAAIKAQLLERNNLTATIQTNGMDIAKIVAPEKASFPVGYIAATIKASGELKAKDGNPDIDIDIDAPTLTLLGYRYHNATATLHASSHEASLQTDIRDINGSLAADLQWHRGNIQHLSGHVRMDELAADHLNLMHKYSGARTSADVDINLSGSNIDNLSGNVDISGLMIETYRRDSILTGPHDITLQTSVVNGIRSTTLSSQPIQFSAQGRYSFSTLPSTALQLASSVMPVFIRQPSAGKGKNNQIDFQLSVKDSTLLTTLLGKRVYIPQESTVNGWIDAAQGKSHLTADIPYLYVAGQTLKNTKLDMQSEGQLATLDLSTNRVSGSHSIPLDLKSSAIDGRLRTQLSFNPSKQTGTYGTVDISTTFPRNPDGSHAINAWIAPTDIIIADTVWNIHPATFSWNQGSLAIHDLDIAQGDNHSIRVDGRMSRQSSDTLAIELKRINLEYIMNLVNFHSVDFGGEVSGNAFASGLMDNPNVDAHITMEHFMFNNSDQGHLKADVNWGETPHHLAIKAHTSDSGFEEDSDISGWIRIGDRPHPDAIDLKVDARKFNLAFINRFSKGIVDNVKGRTDGYVRIFGPLKYIDLEGEMKIDTALMYVPSIGVAYTLANDSVHIRPGEFIFDANANDKYNHTAHLTGSLSHTHFKNMRYSINAETDNVLCYDFPEITSDGSFSARVFATGNVSLNGKEGSLQVDMNIRPNQGTVFTYNVASPDALTDAGFIHYREPAVTEESSVGISNSQKPSNASASGSPVSSDLTLNFSIQATPDAKIQLLMDRRKGDVITLMGNGQLTATLSNKRSFRMFGTYRVTDGQYNINVQDVIHKNFRFQEGGDITFLGDPLQANLNLYAVHTVPSVSLNDLTTQSLGFAKTKVNCIMHLTGRPEQPQISFDFDLPNATDDERQMVKAMVSTEEERNLQAIYLLGIGRFYSYSANATGSSQSSTAVNSVLSSTLSSQINQLISDAVGNSKWNFGTNLSTGDDGWKNMDVEGQLSGSLFDDRLQLTGNFGYREKYYTQRNFISDVDVQYNLTRNGNVALKAYNQANDRYFVQSSLNTQGIGIQLKKGFNRFKEIFKKRKNK